MIRDENLQTSTNSAIDSDRMSTPDYDCESIKEVPFNGCECLTEVPLDLFDSIKCNSMIMLNNMNFEQIQWCKKSGIIENLKPDVAKQLSMCASYAIIPSELIDEFNSL